MYYCGVAYGASGKYNIGMVRGRYARIIGKGLSQSHVNIIIVVLFLKGYFYCMKV